MIFELKSKLSDFSIEKNIFEWLLGWNQCGVISERKIIWDIGTLFVKKIWIFVLGKEKVICDTGIYLFHILEN